MAVLEKHLLGKDKGLCSDPQNTYEKPSSSVRVYRPRGGRDRLTPGACWPARLAPVSSRPARDPVIERGGVAPGDDT